MAVPHDVLPRVPPCRLHRIQPCAPTHCPLTQKRQWLKLRFNVEEAGGDVE